MDEVGDAGAAVGRLSAAVLQLLLLTEGQLGDALVRRGGAGAARSEGAWSPAGPPDPRGDRTPQEGVPGVRWLHQRRSPRAGYVSTRTCPAAAGAVATRPRHRARDPGSDSAGLHQTGTM